MNLANFGEKIGAKSLFLIVEGEHPERAVFNVIFRIIDAKKISLLSESIREIFDESQSGDHPTVEVYEMKI